MAEPVTLRVDATPNPNALKFTASRELWPPRAQTIAAREQALTMPLAARLLDVPGVKSLFFLRDFLTVTREPGADWEPIIAAVQEAITTQYGGAADQG